MRHSIFYKQTTTLIICFLLGLILSERVQGQSWYNTSWLFRKAIIIDDSKVRTGSVTNFPVFISITAANLQASVL